MKILIAYSSGYGATQEVSNEIGKVLSEEKDFDVNVLSIDTIDSIDSYDSIIIGTSVRADRPLANVRDFVATHRFKLPQKKVALFAVCLTANNEQGRQKIQEEFLDKLYSKYPQISPITTTAFGGKIDFDKLNPVMQSLMNKVLDKTGIPRNGSVDTRDWDYIRSWAHDLKEQLLQYETVKTH